MSWQQAIEITSILLCDIKFSSKKKLTGLLKSLNEPNNVKSDEYVTTFNASVYKRALYLFTFLRFFDNLFGFLLFA